MTDTITPQQALKNLIRWYVNLLETGRDRIIAAGGDCDPVEKMEASDPYLREARAALAQQAEQAGWVLVPVEPTAEMINAYASVPYDEGSIASECRSGWRAMLAAAPKGGV